MLWARPITTPPSYTYYVLRALNATSAMRLVLTFSFGRGNPEPWRFLWLDVMVNSMDIVAGRRGVRRPEGVVVWVDSGGYQLLCGSAKSVGVREVAEAQALLRPDYAVMPDDPNSPPRSLERYEEYLEVVGEVGLRATLVPVVHTTWSPGHVCRLLDMYSPSVVAVGGVADSLARPLRLSSARKLLRRAYALREVLPTGVKLHVLGVGGPSLLPALWALGVSSLDTANWIHDARYGVVRVGTRAYTAKCRGRDKLPPLPPDIDCKCPVCREGPEELRQAGLRGLRARAIHNAHNLAILASELSKAPRGPTEVASRLGGEGLLSPLASKLLAEVERIEEGRVNTAV